MRAAAGLVLLAACSASARPSPPAPPAPIVSPAPAPVAPPVVAPPIDGCGASAAIRIEGREVHGVAVAPRRAWYPETRTIELVFESAPPSATRVRLGFAIDQPPSAGLILRGADAWIERTGMFPAHLDDVELELLDVADGALCARLTGGDPRTVTFDGTIELALAPYPDAATLQADVDASCGAAASIQVDVPGIDFDEVDVLAAGTVVTPLHARRSSRRLDLIFATSTAAADGIPEPGEGRVRITLEGTDFVAGRGFETVEASVVGHEGFMNGYVGSSAGWDDIRVDLLAIDDTRVCVRLRGGDPNLVLFDGTADLPFVQ